MFFNSLLKTLFFCLRWILISIPYFISLVCKCPSQIKKLFPVFSVVIFLFLTSCKVNPPPIERTRPKQSDPVKQRECKERGHSSCEGDEDCEEICDDIFSNRKDKQECYEYSSEMVSQFENLIEATEDGDVDEIKDIGSEVLECMLDIDETGFAEAIRKMSRRKTQDFIVLIGKDKDFAEVLEEEDDEFNVLKQLASSVAGSSGLEEALSQEIKDDRTLLWLFSENNKWAWDWLNGYVGEECDGGDSSDCPGGENIGAYCNALLESNFRRDDWEDFLSDADIFAKEYEDEVEDEDYEYEITDSPERNHNGDFRDYCELKADRATTIIVKSKAMTNDDQDGGNPTPCPTSPDTGKNFSRFQLENGFYIHSDRRSYQNRDILDHGSATPQQNIILLLRTGENRENEYLNLAVFDENAISFDQARTYYIYIDNNRYALIPGTEASDSYSANGIDHRVFSIENYPRDAGRFIGAFDVAVASELNGDQCEFYTP